MPSAFWPEFVVSDVRSKLIILWLTWKLETTGPLLSGSDKTKISCTKMIIKRNIYYVFI